MNRSVVFSISLPLILLFISISLKSSAQKKNGIGFIPSKIAFIIDEKDLFPEGLAYDSKTKQFFLTSTSKFKIITIDRKGEQSDFIQAHQDSMLRCVSIKVDAKRRRLWAISNSDWGDSVVSGIHVYDIDSARLIHKIFTPKSWAPVFNDLVLMEDGGAFITDSEGKGIYHVPPDLNEATLFVKSDSLLDEMSGIAISPDNTTLYVASGSKGIILVDAVTKKTRAIKNPLSVDTKGIDGLLRYRNSLIGVMCKDESTEALIVRYDLNLFENEIIAASILDQGNPLFETPTTGVFVDDTFYCLAATFLQLFTLDENNEDPLLGNPKVLKYKMPRK
jgi:hypothetical protein